MKYVLFVLFTFLNPDTGAIEHQKFSVEYDSRYACNSAQAEMEQDIAARYPNALALTTECRPRTPWDEPLAALPGT